MSDENWQEMATVTGSQKPADDLDQISEEIHQANDGPPPHPTYEPDHQLATAAPLAGRYARRTTESVAGRIVNGIVVSDDMVAAIWFSYHGNTPLGAEDAIDRACRRHLQQKATEPIRPELGTLIQELRERRATRTADLPEVAT